MLSHQIWRWTHASSIWIYRYRLESCYLVAGLEPYSIYSRAIIEGRAFRIGSTSRSIWAKNKFSIPDGDRDSIKMSLFDLANYLSLTVNCPNFLSRSSRFSLRCLGLVKMESVSLASTVNKLARRFSWDLTIILAFSLWSNNTSFLYLCS